MTAQELQASIEAIIYAADEPATLEQLATGAGADKNAVREVLERLIANGATEDRGIEIRKVANGYKMYTKPQHHEAVRRFIKSLRPPLRLSMPSLETLAVIAYKQPVTLPEMNEIRGVNCAGVIGTLLERKLVTTAGRKEVVGRPILYRTSREFLMRFGLADVGDLPSLKEFEQLAQAALGADDAAAAPPEPLTPDDNIALTGEPMPESDGAAPGNGASDATAPENKAVGVTAPESTSLLDTRRSAESVESPSHAAGETDSIGPTRDDGSAAQPSEEQSDSANPVLP
jgi:segregation and condensation protein B